jgi:hypothetical protein
MKTETLIISKVVTILKIFLKEKDGKSFTNLDSPVVRFPFCCLQAWRGAILRLLRDFTLPPS